VWNWREAQGVWGCPPRKAQHLGVRRPALLEPPPVLGEFGLLGALPGGEPAAEYGSEEGAEDTDDGGDHGGHGGGHAVTLTDPAERRTPAGSCTSGGRFAHGLLSGRAAHLP